MDKKTKQFEDVRELAERLGYDAAGRRELVDELARGEAALRRADTVEAGPELLERVRLGVRAELARQELAGRAAAGRRGRWWLGGLAAVAAVAAIGMVWLAVWHMGQPGAEPARPEPQGAVAMETKELVDLWELALAHPGETRVEVDTLLISETLTLWREMDWDVDSVFEEQSDENLTTGISIGGRAGVRLV